jgi:hypothetical protein
MAKHEHISSVCNRYRMQVYAQFSVTQAGRSSREMRSLMCGKARDEWAIKWKLKLGQYARDDKVCQVPLTLCSTFIAVIGLTRKHRAVDHAKGTGGTWQ